MAGQASPFNRFFGTSKFPRFYNNKAKNSPTGFHSLADEAQRQADAWDLEEAEEAARREVELLLSSPENLTRLDKIKSEYDAQRAAVEVQLSLLSGRHAEEARAGLAMVSRCRASVESSKAVRAQLISKLEDTQSFADYPLVRRVFLVRRNLQKTLQDLDSILAIPMELQAIERQLAQDSDDPDARDAKDRLLPAVHRRLLALERRQEAALYRARDNPAERAALEEQLGRLDQFAARVAARMWLILRNCTVEAQARPAILVKILQMIERQEAADARVRQAQATGDGGGAGAWGRREVKGWYAEAIRTISDYCEARFDMLVGSLAERAPVDVGLVIREHAKIVDEITVVKDVVEPCFPPRYNIVQLFAGEYHKRVVTLVREGLLGPRLVATLGTRDMIEIVEWLRDYHGQLEGLGIEVTPVLTDDLDMLLQAYNFQTESMLRSWVARILDDDMKEPPESGSDGKLYTIAPIDLFKMIDQQFEVADALGVEKSVYNLAMTVANVLDDYRSAIAQVLADQWSKLGVEHICAQMNNSSKCIDGCFDLQENLAARLSEQHMENVEIERVADDFTSVSKLGSTVLCNIVMSDLAPVFGQRLFSVKWYTQEDLVAQCIVATVEDYAEEWRVYLMESYLRKTLVELLDRLAAAWLVQLLSTKRHDAAGLVLDPPYLESVEQDASMIEECFKGLGMPDKMLKPRIKPFTLFANLISVIIKLQPTDIEGSAQALTAWHQEASGVYRNVPTDAIARLLRLHLTMDGRARNAILIRVNTLVKDREAAAAAAAARAAAAIDSDELLDLDDDGAAAAAAKAAKAAAAALKNAPPLFEQVYAELGVKPGPYVPAEGVVTALMGAVHPTGKARPNPNPPRVPAPPAAARGPAADAADEAESDGPEPVRAIDVMPRLLV